jgi:hypothetical protein
VQSVFQGVENGVMLVGGAGMFGFTIYPVYMKGEFTVVDNDFRGMVEGGVFLRNLDHSKVTIGGSPSAANTFSSVANGLFSFLNIESTDVTFSHNTVASEGVPGATWQVAGEAVLVQQTSSTPSTFAITKNHIQTYGEQVPAEGIGLLDNTGTLKAVVTNNDVVLNSPFAGWGCCWGGAWTYGVQNVVFANNRFSGTLLNAGLYLMLTTAGMFKANNFEQVTALDGVDIILFPDTAENTVVGSGNSTVWDFGTGNVIIGTNNQNGGARGPAIKDAMKRKLEILKRH